MLNISVAGVSIQTCAAITIFGLLGPKKFEKPLEFKEVHDSFNMTKMGSSLTVTAFVPLGVGDKAEEWQTLRD